MKKYVWIIWMLLIPCLVWPTTRYVTQDGGGDHDGTSWANAFAHPDSLNTYMSVGDTALLGTATWYDAKIVPPTGGDNDNWTVYACSTFVESDQLAGKNLPKVWAGTVVTEWTVYSGNVYRAGWTGSGCLFNGQCYTLGQGDSLLVPQTVLGSVDAAGEFWHDLTNDSIYAWCYGGGDPDGYTMIASCKPAFHTYASGTSHIKVFGIEFQYGKQGTVYFQSSADTTIFQHCHIAKAGQDYLENPTCYFSGHASPNGYNNTIVACSLGWAVHEDDDGWEDAFNHGGAIDLYAQEHFVAESCYVYGFVNMGIGFKMRTDGADPPFTGNVAKFNTIIAHGPMNTGVTIYNYPDRDSVYGNIISGTKYGIDIYGGGGEQLPQYYPYKLFIANNSIYKVGVAGTPSGFFIRIYGAKTADTCGVDNEIFYNIGYNFNSTTWGGEKAWVGFADYGVPGCETSYTIDSNLWGDPSDNFYGPTEPDPQDRTWSYWQSSGGWDNNGDTIRTSPFVDADNGNFTLTESAGGVYTMNRTYGGRVWTVWGSEQPIVVSEITGAVSLSGKVTIE